MLGKILGFGRIKKQNIFFCFFKWKFIFLNFQNFWIFFLKFWRKPNIFNTGSVSYSVCLQLNIMKNYWKNLRRAHKYLKNDPWEICFNYYIIINNDPWDLAGLGWADSGLTNLFLFFLYRLGWPSHLGQTQLRWVGPTMA